MSELKDEISKRVRIRITALGFPSMSAWVKEHERRGGDRPYAWWRSLDASSPYQSIAEAARYLDTTPSVLIGDGPRGMGTDEELIRGGTNGERKVLHEGGSGSKVR
jgi:hypothetical protein